MRLTCSHFTAEPTRGGHIQLDATLAINVGQTDDLPLDPILHADDVAVLLGCTERHLRQRIQKGDLQPIPYVRDNGRPYIRLSDFKLWQDGNLPSAASVTAGRVRKAVNPVLDLLEEAFGIIANVDDSDNDANYANYAQQQVWREARDRFIPKYNALLSQVRAGNRTGKPELPVVNTSRDTELSRIAAHVRGIIENHISGLRTGDDLDFVPRYGDFLREVTAAITGTILADDGNRTGKTEIARLIEERRDREYEYRVGDAGELSLTVRAPVIHHTPGPVIGPVDAPTHPVYGGRDGTSVPHAPGATPSTQAFGNFDAPGYDG